MKSLHAVKVLHGSREIDLPFASDLGHLDEADAAGFLELEEDRIRRAHLVVEGEIGMRGRDRAQVRHHAEGVVVDAVFLGHRREEVLRNERDVHLEEVEPLLMLESVGDIDAVSVLERDHQVVAAVDGDLAGIAVAVFGENGHMALQRSIAGRLIRDGCGGAEAGQRSQEERSRNGILEHMHIGLLSGKYMCDGTADP